MMGPKDSGDADLRSYGTLMLTPREKNGNKPLLFFKLKTCFVLIQADIL